MKIKTKKQLNLPQLIEWVWDNPKRHEIRAFIDDTRDFGSEIYVQEHNGFISIQGEFSRFDTFTVEIEEEITEETIIPKMLVVGRFDGYEEVYNQKLINFTQHLLSAYIIQDDGHMELIYDEEKGLVG